jgi:hypothetical protein
MRNIHRLTSQASCTACVAASAGTGAATAKALNSVRLLMHYRWSCEYLRPSTAKNLVSCIFKSDFLVMLLTMIKSTKGDTTGFICLDRGTMTGLLLKPSRYIDLHRRDPTTHNIPGRQMLFKEKLWLSFKISLQASDLLLPKDI